MQKEPVTLLLIATHAVSKTEILSNAYFGLNFLADTDGQIVDHKFMVSGHSFLPNDRDFSQIEQYAKNRMKYASEDWYTIIR